MSEDVRKVVDGDVTVLVRRPTKKDYNESQIVYNKVWRKSLEEKAVLRQKLNEFLIEQGVWSSAKEAEYQDYIKKINDRELVLKKGGIPLKKAKAIALELKKLRVDFRELISERTTYDGNTAEGVADNARFDYLVSVCVLDPNTNKPVFKDMADYETRGAEPWAVKAAGELANFLYNLDPNYEKNLPENDFLSKFHFTNDKGELINKDGHLIAIQDDGTEVLIDSEGYRVAYKEDGTAYRIDREGNPLDVEQSPFLDDDGNPISLNDEAPAEPVEESKKVKKKKSDPA